MPIDGGWGLDSTVSAHKVTRNVTSINIELFFCFLLVVPVPLSFILIDQESATIGGTDERAMNFY